MAKKKHEAKGGEQGIKRDFLGSAMGIVQSAYDMWELKAPVLRDFGPLLLRFKSLFSQAR